MNTPVLLLKKDLLAPIDKALNRLEKIRRRKMANQDDIILEGLFALAVSSFENSMNDTLRVLFKYIPGKLPFKEKQIKKETLIDDSLLANLIEKQIASLSYANIEDIIKEFIDCTDIEVQELPNNSLNKLKEIKATRNLLLHNNLVVNSFYLETAGPLKRKENLGDKLSISQNYLYQSIVSLNEILTFFKNELNDKYKSFTRLRATKKLFEFLFPTPIMEFETEFEISEESDRVLFYKKEESCYNNLSGSERILFDVWLVHFRAKGITNENFNFYILDENKRKKLRFFINVIDLLKT